MAESQPKEYPGEQPCKSWQNQDQGYKGSTRDNQKRQFRLKVYVFYLRELAHVYAKRLLTYGNHSQCLLRTIFKPEGFGPLSRMTQLAGNPSLRSSFLRQFVC